MMVPMAVGAPAPRRAPGDDVALHGTKGPNPVPTQLGSPQLGATPTPLRISLRSVHHQTKRYS